MLMQLPCCLVYRLLFCAQFVIMGDEPTGWPSRKKARNEEGGNNRHLYTMSGDLSQEAKAGMDARQNNVTRDSIYIDIPPQTG